MKNYVIVRSEQAGCFAGFLESQEEAVITLTEARRLWYWEGAASLSQLATTGTSKPDACKFPAAVSRESIRNWIEIIDCSPEGQKSIQEVKIWLE